MENIKANNKSTKFIKLTAIVLFLAIVLSACSSNTIPEVLQYDDYGEKQALYLAENYPHRPAGSEAEAKAAEYINSKFNELGYKTEVSEFSSDNGIESKNIIVKIPGKGFVASEDADDTFANPIYEGSAKSAYGLFNRQVIVGARYDTNPNNPDANQGISDNASGVGALLQLARKLKDYTMGYDIVLIALGGGFDGNAGAKNYIANMSEAELKKTDAFYEFRSLYAGEKLYVNSGLASTFPNQKYKLRQPAYEITDIASKNNIRSLTGVTLYQNQSGIKIANPAIDAGYSSDLGEAPEEIIFREVTNMNSDYRAFDQLAIPCVILESYNYNVDSVEELRDNNDPNFASSDFKVRGTEFDNIETLNEYMADNLLKDRINVSAYLVLKSIATGVIGADTEY